MAVTLTLSGGGITSTKAATNAKALDILTRNVIKLGMYDPETDPEPTDQQKADFWLAEILKWAQHLARDHRKEELRIEDNAAVDADTDFDWDEI